MTYNFEQYIKLLEYQKELSKEKKFLHNENPAKHSELLKQSARISEHLYWLHKQEFKQLINDFLSFKINGKDFDQKFSQLVREIGNESGLKNQAKLKSIEVNSKSLGFGSLISEIYLCCDEFYEEYDPNEGYDPALKTEEQLRQAIKDLLPKIQEYYSI